MKGRLKSYLKYDIVLFFVKNMYIISYKEFICLCIFINIYVYLFIDLGIIYIYVCIGICKYIFLWLKFNDRLIKLL